jgi:hypothetical protein
MRFFSVLILGLFVAFGVSAQDDEGMGWPREIEKKGYLVTFYQPQLESFDQNMLEGRMAVSIKKKDGQPVFGATWFQTRVVTDYDTRMVTFEDLEFKDGKFPDIEEEDYKGLKDVVMKEIGKWDLTISMDRFLATLETIKSPEEEIDDNGYDNTPPIIYYRKEPAILIMVDGGATLQPTEESSVMRVVNTPFFVVLETKKNKYYINGGDWWFESEKLEEEWKQVKKPPKSVRKYYESQNTQTSTELDSVATAMDDPPEIIVSTEAAELILSDGEPEFKSVEGTELLYLSNSESDVILDLQHTRRFGDCQCEIKYSKYR